MSPAWKQKDQWNNVDTPRINQHIYIPTDSRNRCQTVDTGERIAASLNSAETIECPYEKVNISSLLPISLCTNINFKNGPQT